MAESTIEWTDYTFNPWIGCSKVSPGCAHCYAERTAIQRKNWGVIWGVKGSRVRTSPSTWQNPYSWNRKATQQRRRFKVFCASLADVFEDRADLVTIRHDLFKVIQETSQLDWLLLTKRPENIAKMLPANWGQGWPNVWLGTSAEDQKYYDERIGLLLAVPAKIHFISAEPLIGLLEVRHDKSEGLDWVIVGGESGPGFREMDLNWPRKIRDDCAKRGVTFFFKQHSAFRPKSKGKLLDGKTYHNWPDNSTPPSIRKVGRPQDIAINASGAIETGSAKISGNAHRRTGLLSRIRGGLSLYSKIIKAP